MASPKRQATSPDECNDGMEMDPSDNIYVKGRGLLLEQGPHNTTDWNKEEELEEGTIEEVLSLLDRAIVLCEDVGVGDILTDQSQTLQTVDQEEGDEHFSEQSEDESTN